jgi:hypothetical protein
MTEPDRPEQADREETNTPGECEAELKKLLNTRKARLKEMEDSYGKKLEEQEMRFSMDTERLLNEQHEKYQEQLALQERRNQAQMEEMMQRLRLNNVLPGGQMNEDQGRSSPRGFGFESDLSGDDEVQCNSGGRKYQEGVNGARSKLPGGQEATGGGPKIASIPGLLNIKPGLNYSTPRHGQVEGAAGGQEGGSRNGTSPPHSKVKFLPRGVESGNSYVPYETQRPQYSQEELALLRKMEQQGHEDRVMLDRLESVRRDRAGAENVGVRGSPGGASVQAKRFLS